LQQLDLKIEKTVYKTGRSKSLEPMNPYERRIIHSVIADFKGVSSHSVGDEP
jgi:spoIIIJ-associated protein